MWQNADSRIRQTELIISKNRHQLKAQIANETNRVLHLRRHRYHCRNPGPEFTGAIREHSVQQIHPSLHRFAGQGADHGPANQRRGRARWCTPDHLRHHRQPGHPRDPGDLEWLHDRHLFVVFIPARAGIDRPFVVFRRQVALDWRQFQLYGAHRGGEFRPGQRRWRAHPLLRQGRPDPSGRVALRQDPHLPVHGHAVRHPRRQLPVDRGRHGAPAAAGGVEEAPQQAVRPDHRPRPPHRHPPRAQAQQPLFQLCPVRVRSARGREPVPPGEHSQYQFHAFFGGRDFGEDSGRERGGAAVQVNLPALHRL